MSVIDRDLTRAINSGTCFALVGSGPSCKQGVASWKQLAEKVIDKINTPENQDVVAKCRKLLSDKKYPEIFSATEKIISKEELLKIVEASMIGNSKRNRIYEFISLWPFACYLTTNFDDYLSKYLSSAGLPFIVRRNSLEDMQALRGNSKNIIFKIHGDTSVPEDIVLTSEQYTIFRKDPSREYWREKIKAALHMVDLVIIGYSASDPDFVDQLERAKFLAAPNHPVFMFAADISTEDIEKYYQQYNIRILPYKNNDGSHRELEKLLKRYDPFIAKRKSPHIGLEPIDESISSLASSMYLFTQLRLSDTTDACIEKAYASLILQILSGYKALSEISIDAIKKELATKTFSISSVDPHAMNKALEFLFAQGFVSIPQDKQVVILETKGSEIISSIKAERRLILDKFEKICNLFLEKEYPDLNNASHKTIIAAMQIGLVNAYQKRGIEIARAVFTNDLIDLSDATDVLETINSASASLRLVEERTAFADLMIEVMLRPIDEMKEYLVLLSQGYFAYHALGLDPRCSQNRLNIAKQQPWIFDSSILLPALARHCLNHDYALDLLRLMQNMGLLCYTTERLFDEVREHAWWAMHMFKNVPSNHTHFLQAAMSGPGYKQNLFLDGFMKWSLTQGTTIFHDYMVECFGPNYDKELTDAIRKKISDLKIEVVNFKQWSGITDDIWPERDLVADQIEKLRKDYGTYRGASQCIAEAEVVIVSHLKNAVFLSQSSILNNLPGKKPKITWRPEAMYRFLTLFSTAPTGSDLLYKCMLQDLYYAGFDIVDTATITRFAEHTVRQARMQIDHERARYEEALGRKKFVELREDFELIPDEQKPFYSMQFAFYVADQETRRRESAEMRAKQAEASQRLSTKEREEYEKLKHKKDEKRRKAEKNKRRAASKPKKKKKK